jgi:uncharacterized protein YndB with AHSA1/START domain
MPRNSSWRFRVIRIGTHASEAVADPDVVSYFTTNGAKGRLETGATVMGFRRLSRAFPVHVVEVEQDRRIVLRWEAADDGGDPYETTVTMEFEPLDDGRTLVTISEDGWRDTAGGQEASYSNCEGWTGMLCAMKARLEYGINLDGFK